MHRYQFTGEQEEIFPSIVIQGADGTPETLTAQPGQVIELVTPVTHPRLVDLDPDPKPEA